MIYGDMAEQVRHGCENSQMKAPAGASSSRNPYFYRMIGRAICISALLGLVVWSCTSLTRGSAGETRPGPAEGIALVSLKARMNADSTVNIELIDFTAAPGRLKPSAQRPLLNRVRVDLLDSNDRIIGNLDIEHPLIEVLEYADDDGVLGILTRRLDSALFYIRLKQDPQLASLRLTTSGATRPVIQTSVSLSR